MNDSHVEENQRATSGVSAFSTSICATGNGDEASLVREVSGAQATEPAITTLTGPAIFASQPMRVISSLVRRIRLSDISVLVKGESGTGKEVVAQAIHQASLRAKGPWVPVNCAALPEHLVESLLFGSKKGAFTGADRDQDGIFQQAHGGTLFLDEVTEMPIDAQAKLLRVLQEKEILQVGSTVTRKVDCRIVASTNRDPWEAIREGKLREDLWHRLSAIVFRVPPLRERKDDIMLMAHRFFQYFAVLSNPDVQGFSAAAQEALIHYDWPGNVRELQNTIHRAVLMADPGQLIDVCHLELPEAEQSEKTELIDRLTVEGQAEENGLTVMEQMERNAIVAKLIETHGNKLKAAKELGIGRQTLDNKIKNQYGIQLDEYDGK